jgi:hypothetical protein
MDRAELDAMTEAELLALATELVGTPPNPSDSRADLIRAIDRLSLDSLRARAAALGITQPKGHSRHKKTWANAIIGRTAMDVDGEHEGNQCVGLTRVGNEYRRVYETGSGARYYIVPSSSRKEYRISGVVHALEGAAARPVLRLQGSSSFGGSVVEITRAADADGAAYDKTRARVDGGGGRRARAGDEKQEIDLTEDLERFDIGSRSDGSWEVLSQFQRAQSGTGSRSDRTTDRSDRTIRTDRADAGTTPPFVAAGSAADADSAGMGFRLKLGLKADFHGKDLASPQSDVGTGGRAAGTWTASGSAVPSPRRSASTTLDSLPRLELLPRENSYRAHELSQRETDVARGRLTSRLAAWGLRERPVQVGACALARSPHDRLSPPSSAAPRARLTQRSPRACPAPCRAMATASTARLRTNFGLTRRDTRSRASSRSSSSRPTRKRIRTSWWAPRSRTTSRRCASPAAGGTM